MAEGSEHGFRQPPDDDLVLDPNTHPTMDAAHPPIPGVIPPPQLGRRYLRSFNISRISHRFTDVLVLGSGVSGLSAALAAAAGGARVLLAAKDSLEETATRYAQGGVAAVLDPERMDDSLEQHVEDTLAAAQDIADEGVVRWTLAEGVERVRALIGLGAELDRDAEGHLVYTLEGGHSRPRILHRGDTTGQEIERVLLAAVERDENITALPNTFAVDLLTGDDPGASPTVVRGALVHRPHGEVEAVWARRTILATGGLGRLYRESTNPAVSTGDGIAMAFRAGAVLSDLEFVQFHPTTLYLAGADRFLITEAVRGEGGVLRDGDGHRFMPDYDERAELAPRDVVSRSVIQHMRERRENKVYLDLSSIPAERIRLRFPRILEFLKQFDIDILTESIPVRPSAHYAIGGVETDIDGRTSLDGLFAAGEVAATGLHGANRLASNSLLEGLVFGHRSGECAAAEASATEMPEPFSVLPEGPRGRRSRLDVEDLATSLRSVLWQRVGLERSGSELAKATQQIAAWLSYGLDAEHDGLQRWGLQNALATAYLLTYAAWRREESRGVHYRMDFPDRKDAEWCRRLQLSRATLLPGTSPGTSPDGSPAGTATAE